MIRRTNLSAEDKYSLLLAISEKVRDTLDLDEILNHLLDTIKTILDYDAAGVFVLNQEIVHDPYWQPSELIAGVVRRGFDSGKPPSLDPMLSSGKGITGHVIRTGESVICPDVRQDERYVVGRITTLSEIAVPILRGARPIGALNLESDRLAAFDKQDVELLRFFADAAAISIEKAMLHRRLVEKELLEKQLQTAREIQERLLPASAPQREGYDIAGLCLPTFAIGGDYYDFLRLSNQQLGVVIADVSGHGIPAALVMAAFRANLRANARKLHSPVHVMRMLNHLLPDFSAHAYYVTAVYGVLDPKQGGFRYITCGHPRPLVFRTGGQTEKLETAGVPLGIFPGASFQEGEVNLAPGDLLLLHTDGVVELENPAGEPYSLAALIELVQQVRHLSAENVIEAILAATRSFSGSDVYRDDFSLIVIKRNGQ